MTFDPQKLFIGLIDLFSIWLPGAMLAFLLLEPASLWLLEQQPDQLHGGAGWLVFLFSSYLCGHFIFLFGTYLDELYDVIRGSTYTGQVRRLAEGKQLRSTLARALATMLVGSYSDPAVRQAELAMRRSLEPLAAAKAINAFQWSKARLALTQPEALAAVQRFEADSKFFRSFVVISLIAVVAGVFMQRPMLSATFLLLTPLAFLRYFDQRLKSTNQAYWYILTLEGSTVGGVRRLPRPAATHAGGVVYHRHGNSIAFVLIKPRKAPDDAEWVLPKGHVEPWESLPEAAVREVREETGFWARVREPLSLRQYTAADGEHVRVQYYLMEALDRDDTADQDDVSEDRGWQCLPIEAALAAEMNPDVRAVLLQAAERVGAITRVRIGADALAAANSDATAAVSTHAGA